jgi:hypothetical protein
MCYQSSLDSFTAVLRYITRKNTAAADALIKSSSGNREVHDSPDSRFSRNSAKPAISFDDLA